MTPETIEQAADILADRRRQGGVLPEFAAELTPADLRQAYDLQAALMAQLGRRGGWKIGCTTRVMQKFLGIDSPCAGGILADRIYHASAAFKRADFCRVGIECEIAVRLDRDVSAAGGPYDGDNIGDHVGAVMAAMEIVDDRYGDFRRRPLPLLVADDFFQSAAIVGPAQENWRALDLGALAGGMWIDGVEQGRGRGVDILGAPLKALAWLANLLASQGRGLEAGEIVLLGSVVATQWIDQPATAETEIEGLGRLRATFS